MNDTDRELLRAALRRFDREHLTSDEVAEEIERAEQQRALFVGDLRAEDFSVYPETVIRNAIALLDVELGDLERQAKRFVRSTIVNQRSFPKADFAAARYVDCIGLVQSLTAQPGKKQGNGAYLFRCPFHDGDREPSLRVYPPGRGWVCFGCGKGGRDATSFFAEFFHCSQIEGLRWVEQLCDGFF